MVVSGGLALSLWALGLTGKISQSTAEVLDLVKLGFALVAGVAGTVGLVLAYQRHLLAVAAADREQAKETREDTKLFNERFEKAATLLAADAYATKLAGVYAMAKLADDWVADRQVCINVLCAYLRRRHVVEPDGEAETQDALDWHDDQEIRRTIVAVIGKRLRDEKSSWQGLNFDFTGAHFSGTVDFRNAIFSGGTVNFRSTIFSHSLLKFNGATFSDGLVTFAEATISNSTADFGHTTFSGGTLEFNRTTFSESMTHFRKANISGGSADFRYTKFSGGTINFRDATISAGKINFIRSTLSCGTADFSRMKFLGGIAYFGDANFPEGTVDFNTTAFANGTVDFGGAAFSGSDVNFDAATFSGSIVTFSKTAMFENATFSGGSIDFSRAANWSVPPVFPFQVDSPPAGVLLPPSN
jgi:uncharacterized protein YjbI with pentapeptide repeats